MAYVSESELSIGYPSRNVLEKIFRAALAEHSKHRPRRIHHVYKVFNSFDKIETFEKYREMVKKRATVECAEHPGSSVDGNELLRFYGTTMTCCDSRRNKVSKPCNYSSCGVCRILKSNFNTEYIKRKGIRLGRCSEDWSESSGYISIAKNVKRAVIVCRTIAGPLAI